MPRCTSTAGFAEPRAEPASKPAARSCMARRSPKSLTREGELSRRFTESWTSHLLDRVCEASLQRGLRNEAALLFSDHPPSTWDDGNLRPDRHCPDEHGIHSRRSDAGSVLPSPKQL